ncbi:MAG TPA: hypothetical protein DCE42_08885 [Myxococcales bacterium]|nr:hypothetical protein [Deltaproteobacteria bacterium]HAA54861.1 hypothetical protein [Myxococcales bacterium]
MKPHQKHSGISTRKSAKCKREKPLRDHGDLFSALTNPSFRQDSASQTLKKEHNAMKKLGFYSSRYTPSLVMCVLGDFSIPSVCTHALYIRQHIALYKKNTYAARVF